ncbi:MAG: hypothetical protein KY476_03430 [Planctomycetes bacterium]|nr:hypothetical protein [Planctomycetota bacterium]
MPRIIEELESPAPPHFPELVDGLIEELRSTRAGGQPLIREQRFPRTDALRVTVIWDRWEPLSDQDRVETILAAYEAVEGREFRDRIALAIGLTVPEAAGAGLLPFQVTPLVRRGDLVTLEQCRNAMLAEGASVLSDPHHPQLRFATMEEAASCIKRLSEALPASEAAWTVQREIIGVPSETLVPDE